MAINSSAEQIDLKIEYRMMSVMMGLEFCCNKNPDVIRSMNTNKKGAKKEPYQHERP